MNGWVLLWLWWYKNTPQPRNKRVENLAFFTHKKQYRFVCGGGIAIVIAHWAQCLKITEKVSFNIASEASYVYILSGQKFLKNAKIGPFGRVFEKLMVKQCYQTGHFQWDKNWRKMPKLKNSNATFLVIFNLCDWAPRLPLWFILSINFEFSRLNWRTKIQIFEFSRQN